MVLVRVRVPALGHSLCVIEPRPVTSSAVSCREDPRVEHPAPWVLENECVRAAFDRSGRLTSLIDKQTGMETLAGPAGFGFIEEDTGRSMTAWIVGRTMRETCVHDGPVKLLGLETGSLRSTLSYQVPFGAHSLLTVTIRLDSGSPLLVWETNCRFLEWGTKETRVRPLFFAARPAGAGEKCRYDAPLGPVVRPELPMDVPALTHAAVPCAGRSLLLSAPGKHGYHYENGWLGVTLIRGSFDPDPFPELGNHAFTVALGPTDDAPCASYRLSDRLTAPLSTVSDGVHPGTEKAEEAGLSVEGPARLLCFKAAEDGQGYILRLASLSDRAEAVTVTLPQTPLSAEKVDRLERPAGAFAVTVSERSISFEMGAYGLVSLRIAFK